MSQKKRNTTSLDHYGAFVSSHFIGDDWMNRVRQDLNGRPEEALPSDLFRFFGLVGIVVAQYGFESLNGQIFRHKDKKWKLPPTHHRHQRGVAIYTAKVNFKSYKIKNALIKKDSDFYPGIWGVSLYVSSGGITEDVSNPHQVRRWANDRMKISRPICLPDRELNEQLAVIPFSGNIADTMLQDEFENEILPELQKVTQELLNPIPVFRSR